MDSLNSAFGPGWLGNLLGPTLTLLGGAFVGWIARRPLEKAGIAEAVNKRLETYMKHLEAELQRITSQHEKCEQRLDALEEQGRKDREEIEQLRGQVAQEKQIAASLARVGGVT